MGNAGVEQMPPVPENDRNPGTRTEFEGDSSDFGDDDLDQDLMELADASADPFVDSDADRNEFGSLGSSAWSSFAADKLQPKHPAPPPLMNSKPPTVNNLMNNETKPDDSDDFDDDYGDFDDNFEEILAECDEKQEHINSSKPVTSEQHIVEKTNASAVATADRKRGKSPNIPAQEFEAASSEDEFDDDFDLDAIEQTMKEAGQDGDNVCYS